jgi:hypothetical protein
MADILTEPKTELLVGEPIMKGFMRSIVYPVEIPDHLEDWERVDLFREQVEVRLTKFRSWIGAIVPALASQDVLTVEQLGKVAVRRGEKANSVHVIHEATQMEAVGKDEDEARIHLADSLNNQLERWQAEGDLETQSTKLSADLTEEYRQKFAIPW